MNNKVFGETELRTGLDGWGRSGSTGDMQGTLPEAVEAERVWGMAVASFQGMVCRSTWTFRLKQRAPAQGAELAETRANLL